MHDDPTSGDLNRLVEEEPGGGKWRTPRDDVETILEVSVDAVKLSDRAARDGRDIGEIVADVLRHAAA